MKNNYDVIVIGGGAAGMMSAIVASETKRVLIIDHNEKLGKKLYITGKGRCNLTNNSSVENHLNNIVTNNKFMYSALNNMTPQQVMSFFENHGLKLKTERGNRVFPVSDKSSDVIRVLEKVLKQNQVDILLNHEIIKIIKNQNSFQIMCSNNVNYTTSSVVIATGGVSYPGTGATGLGYKIAKDFGHNVIKPHGALCPIMLKEDVSSLNGLSLKNVQVSVEIGNKCYKQIGEAMFTYDSLTGPVALTLSSLVTRQNLSSGKLYIDFKPGLTEQQLDEKFQREFVEHGKKDFKTYLKTLLPAKIIEYFVSRAGVGNKKMALFNKNDRNILIKNLKKFDFCIKSLDNINVSIVTSGGVDVKQIDARTCQSKLVKNLYFVGEVLDVDALTGGYNLQIAWSTGALAGKSLKG